MNKKGQLVGLIFGLLVFLIVYALFLASWIGTVSEMWVSSGNLTGIEAFFASNLQGIVLLSGFIGVLWLSYVGSQ